MKIRAFLLPAITLLSAGAASAGFLTVTNLSTGTNGSFTGNLDGIGVAAAITSPLSNFQLAGTGSSYNNSNLAGTSAQYSDGSIYTPSTGSTYAIGYNFSNADNFNTATLLIAFASAVTNPIFQVASVDGMQYNFGNTAGLGGLVLLSGNGGGGDGLEISGTIVRDADPTTALALAPATAPTTSGARSGYGSVQLTGSFTLLQVDFSFNPASTLGSDGGNFTIATASATPEPSTFLLLAGTLALAAGIRLTRRTV